MKVSHVDKNGYFSFICTGCDEIHRVPVNADGKETNEPFCWGFNLDLEKPTITPSIGVNMQQRASNRPLCHSFVRNGQIQYLNDCTHSLAGQTVDLTPYKN